jgi:hypothetical protein
MSTSFDDFRETLSSDQKTVLDRILDEETRQKSREILKHIETDQKHLEIVNFCANFFLPGELLPEKTGYLLYLIEPLYTLGIKNFDLGFFRRENASLILTECKSSISDPGKLVDDLNKAIDATKSNKNAIEKIFGNKIADPIEFALCIPAIDAPIVHKEIIQRQASICTWAAAQFERKIRLLSDQTDTRNEILAGRLHKDGNLNSFLGNGVESKLRAIRSISILPSSHMCTLMVHVGELIYRGSKAQGSYGEFQYSDVFSILTKEMGRMTGLSEKDFDSLVTSILTTGKRKGIFKDLTDDVQELPRKTFQIAGRRSSAETVHRDVKETYINHNAREKAESESLLRYKKEKGITTLNSHFK